MLNVAFLIVLAIASVLGVRSTWRLFALYRRVAPTLPDRRKLILQSYVVVSGIVTAAAIFFGILATRRLLGYEPMAWTQAVSFGVSAVVLLVPLYLDGVIRAIAAEEEKEV